MMKSVFLLLIVCIAFQVKAQQFSLTHSSTMYDSFENPVQPAFTVEKSKKYSFSILPHINANFSIKGIAEPAFKSLLWGKGETLSNTLPSSETSSLQANINTYLFMFRIFRTAEYQREMGFSLQFRNQGKALASNTALAIPYTTNFLDYGSTYNNTYINTHNNVSFWQLGFSYRENYNSKIAFGAKVSYLSGAVYSDMFISSSAITMYPNSASIHLSGNHTNSFGHNGLNLQSIIPGFKNPGFAISLGTSYTFKNKMYLTANLKDVGMIFWGKNNHQYIFNDGFSVNTANQDNYKGQFYDGFNQMISNYESSSGKFKTTLNSSAEAALSKQFGKYKPVFVASKTLNNSNGFVALQNNYKHRSLNVALNAAYHLNYGLELGSLFMIKSDNAEFFLGTERLLPTYHFGKGYITKNENIGKSPTQADIFIGLNIKYGRRVQTIGFADFIDGLNDKETGYVSRMSKKDKRAVRKGKAKKPKN